MNKKDIVETILAKRSLPEEAKPYVTMVVSIVMDVLDKYDEELKTNKDIMVGL